ncbi:MAG: beta-propeller fold lactonase family protein [Verrucomicrobia bacterium]|nr:beta-propeller fold lactonase family protein [Verrucomicrobiota bacterium]
MLLKLVKLYLFLILVCQSFILHAQDVGSFEPVEGSPFATGCNPTSIAFSPEVSGNLFAAVTNRANNTVSAYTVDIDSGTFTLVSSFPTGHHPVSVDFSPEVSGNVFAAVASNDSVFSYTVDTDSGVFTRASRHFIAGDCHSVAFSPEVSGNLFAAIARTHEEDGDIFVYKVDINSGSFHFAQFDHVFDGANSVAFSPEVSGNVFLADTIEFDDAVDVYKVNTNSGTLAFVTSGITSEGPFSVAFSPEVSGNVFAAVANRIAGNVNVYKVNTTTGTLTQVPGSPFAAGGHSRSVAFSPEISGNLFAAVANEADNTVSVYIVDTATGTFTEVSDSPFPTGDRPYSVAFSPEVSGNVFAGVANYGDRTVSVYKVVE